MIKAPYLLFLGDAQDQLAAKTAHGIAYWRRDNCIGQIKLQGCQADVGLPDLTLEEAKDLGAKTLIVGVANRGGTISEIWMNTFFQAIDLGYDIASGLHQRLSDDSRIVSSILNQMTINIKDSNYEFNGQTVYDVRHPTKKFNVGTGEKRSGNRILTIGTDCSVGKMYTTLALEQEMKKHGYNVDFRATGQTGILIAGSGVCVDAVVSDFISGAIEDLCPENDENHWDVIEGQGSLLHPSYAGVTLGLIHGAQPDYLVICHDPTRVHMRGLPNRPMPDFDTVWHTALSAARLTNPNASFLGICLNTSSYSKKDAEKLIEQYEMDQQLYTCDPVRDGVSKLVDLLDSINAQTNK